VRGSDRIMAVVPKPKRPQILILTAATAAIVLIVVAIFVANSVTRSQKLAQYIGIVRNYPGASFLPDAPLGANFDHRCNTLGVLHSQAAALAAAERNWAAVKSSSHVTERVYLANNLAFYEAARATC
jgi:amino acid transporter